MKKNESIVQTNPNYCYIHKEFMGVDVPAVHLHHMIHGVANRKLADKYGCYCFLCLSCHTNLHDKGLYDLELQQIAEKTWLKHYNKSIEDWIRVFGKNYLD